MAENPMLAIYLHYSDRLDNHKARRQTENRYFFSLISALAVAGAYLIDKSATTSFLSQIIPGLIAVLLIVVLLIWQINLTIYRRSARAMHMVLRELEKNNLFPCDQKHYYYLTGVSTKDKASLPGLWTKRKYSFFLGIRNLFPLLLLAILILYFLVWGLCILLANLCYPC